MIIVVEYSKGDDGYEVYTSVNLDHPDLAKYIADAFDLSDEYTMPARVCVTTFDPADGCQIQCDLVSSKSQIQKVIKGLKNA
ncbi:hypothetical protein SI804_000445 [Escherichia coli]|nr:hypothetical protein [Escherichia coli]